MEAITKINKSIENFFSSYANVKVICSSDFFYDDEANLISWTFLTSKRQDETFTDFFENELHCPICNSFIYSIFHEFGHKMTFDSFNEFEQDFYYLQKEAIEENYEGQELERDYAYYNLSIERAASLWAVDFIKKHLEEIKNWFDNEIVGLYNEIFKDEEFADYVNKLLEE